MANIHNHTGAPHLWFEQAGPEGNPLDVLVVRATFDFSLGGDAMSIAAEQSPISFGDSFDGPVEKDPLRAWLKEDGDLVPYKPGTDIVITGQACAPRGRPRKSWEATVQVGSLSKQLRLHGPRQFQKGFFGWRVGEAEAVAQVRLDYRNAWGGSREVPVEVEGSASTQVFRCAANPVGCGWLPQPADYEHLDKPARQAVAKWVKSQKFLEAPQIESVADPVQSPFHNAEPVGLGPIARWWAPRVGYQGTYDDAWLESRYPVLPSDFDSRYYQSAPVDLVAVPHLKGDERVTLAGLLPETRDMQLPGWRIVAVVTRESGEATVTLPLLDTVRFNLDRGQASLVWRAVFDRDDPVVEVALAATTAPLETEEADA